MVDEALAAAMNDCAVDFPPEQRSGGNRAGHIAVDRRRRAAAGGRSLCTGVPAAGRACVRTGAELLVGEVRACTRGMV